MFLLRETRQSDGFPIFDVCSLEIVYLKTSISHDCHDMATFFHDMEKKHDGYQVSRMTPTTPI